MKKVLVVDDSKTVRQYHKEILKQNGYDAYEAENGMEALEKTLIEDFELFLVDINMPVMDGYSFVKELRTNDKHAYTPVIMISTEAEDHDRISAYKNGANLYFTKPVKPDDLIGSVEILTFRSAA
ncbi:MAG: response regulator [Epsilonproteobacteria bacterium]|nr:response regulator [Campylobacterota bacterium]